jgi:hypothetical protein
MANEIRKVKLPAQLDSHSLFETYLPTNLT